MEQDNGYLAEEAFVARFLGKSIETLRRWRRLRTGPAWVRVGRTPMYRREDVAAWMLANRVETPAVRAIRGARQSA